jgi:hypothetical protein
MAWERRERGGRYYTRSKRVNGQVVREYIGTGALAEAMAKLDALDRVGRQIDADAWREAKSNAVERREAVRALAVLIDDVVAVELGGCEFHEHKGEWRRWRR